VTQDSQVSENLSPENTGTLDERNSKCPDGKILVHNQEGVYFMDKDRWPTLEIAAGPQDQILTQEEDLMDNTAIQLEEQTDKEDSQEWEVQKPKKKGGRQKKKKQPAVATRASARVPRDGVPIAAKDIARAQKRDDSLQGMSNSNFTILNSASNSYLREVMGDLEVECNDFDTEINTFKAEELVRADLAKANYKAYIDKNQ
jgi:hypothetical protein